MLTGPYSYIPGVTFIDNNGNNIYENGIDTPLDTAVNFLGPIGLRVYPGAKNIGLNSAICSFKNVTGYHDPSTINEVRNYMLGLSQVGVLLDPCTFAFGEVRGGVGCNLVDPRFWFSGDPVTNVGWICTENRDLRGAGSSGPFTLVKDKEVEILIGYEIDRGTTPLGGITAVRAVSDAIQTFYENNFGYPIVSVEDEIPLAANFKLEQNYPNPFNPITTIRYELPQDGQVTIEIFDILGQKVGTIVNEYKKADRYEVTFRSTGLASGVYIYQLRVNDFITSKKMVLVR